MNLLVMVLQGKFEYNGGCGYLLKPEFMCRCHFLIVLMQMGYWSQ